MKTDVAKTHAELVRSSFGSIRALSESAVNLDKVNLGSFHATDDHLSQRVDQAPC